MKGQLFETFVMWYTSFGDMSIDSFRKYVSRLLEEKELTFVSKGLYYVGNKLPEDIYELVKHYYLDNSHSCYGDKTLLYELNLIDYCPSIITILTPMVRGNRNIGPIRIKKVDSFPGIRKYRELFELLSLRSHIDDEHLGHYAMQLTLRIPSNEEELKHFIMIINHSEIIYPRIVYFRLSDLFTKLNIDFDIIKWYENAYVKSHHLSDSKD